jgi:peptide/nickel transport system permease protein
MHHAGIGYKFRSIIVVRYVTRRLIFILPVAFIVCFITFMMIHLVPGDPAQILLGEYATPQMIAAMRAQLGEDKPLPVQFGLWFWHAIHGNLGISLQLQQPVSQVIIQRIPATAELGVSALIFSLVIGIPLGVYAATHRNTWIDWLVSVTSLFGVAIPNFVLGLLLIFFLAVGSRIFPPGGYVPFTENPAGNLRDLVLPMITLGAASVAVNMRQIRASMIEALNQDYIRTARAKGLVERNVQYAHALRNALLPLLTIVGLQVGAILGGAFVVESVFLWPGIGQLTILSITAKDYPLVQGVVLIAALSYMAANLLVDICYVIIDPRIRFDNQ